MSIFITKGKLLKDHCEVEYVKLNNEKKAECKEISKSKPHEDLTNAFDKLKIHLALIGEFVDKGKAKTVPKLMTEELFSVTGFTIKSDEEINKVILTGHKILKTGKPLIFNTPSVSEDEDENYFFFSDLRSCIETCQTELESYLFNGKTAPEAQLELQFSEEGNIKQNE
jgi:hypothetical protein